MGIATTRPCVEIVEVAPRDGLQNEPVVLPVADRVSLIGRALDAGAKRIEVASFVSAARVPQMANAEAVMSALPRRADARYSVLVLNERGFERAIAAGCEEVNFVVVASETLSRRNQGAGIGDTLTAWRWIATSARRSEVALTVTIAAAFGCPFEGPVDPDRVEAIVTKVLEDDPAEVAFADTIGCGVPRQVHDLVSRARRHAPALPLRCHFHDTRRTGMMNAAAAIEAGVTVLDSSIGGFGGCPFAPGATGNIATEDLLYFLERSGVHASIDLDATIASARWLGNLLGKAPDSGVGRAAGFPSKRDA
jgi:isopropylmalate/homocitrate/citramalate synthase